MLSKKSLEIANKPIYSVLLPAQRELQYLEDKLRIHEEILATFILPKNIEAVNNGTVSYSDFLETVKIFQLRLSAVQAIKEG